MKIQFILFPLLFFIISTLKGQNIEISGRIDGISDSAKLIFYLIPLKLYENVIYKEINSTKGEFELISHLDTTMWHLVQIDCEEFNTLPDSLICNYQTHTSLKFFIYPGDKIKIQAKKVKYGSRYQVNGNNIGLQQNEFKENVFELEQEYAELVNSKNHLILDHITNEKIKSLKEKIDSINMVNINEHLDWDYSASMLPLYEIEIIQKIYKKLDQKVKDSFFGKYVEEIISTNGQ